MHSGRTRIQWWVRSRTIKCLFLKYHESFPKDPTVAHRGNMGSFTNNKLGQHNVMRVFHNLYLFVITSISGFFFLFKKIKKEIGSGLPLQIYILWSDGVSSLYTLQSCERFMMLLTA